MASHMISVCIFCFICATHSPCASHAMTTQEHILPGKDIHNHGSYNSLSVYKDFPSPDKPKPYSSLNVLDSAIKKGRMHRLEKRNSDISSSVNSDTEIDFIKKIFEIYGDGETMNIQEFLSLVKEMSSHHDHKEDTAHSEQHVLGKNEMDVKQNETEVINQKVRF